MKNINVRIEPHYKYENEARYVFEAIGIFLGVKFQIREGTEDIHINYGNKLPGKIINISPDDYRDWLFKKPHVQWVEGIPILSVNKKDLNTLSEQDNNGIELTFDIVTASFYLLSRQEEVINKKRDIWNCFSGKYSILNDLGILEFPIINSYTFLLKRFLEEVFPGEFNFTDIWPEKKNFAIALMHDVDRPFKGDIDTAANIIKGRRGFKQLPKVLLDRASQKVFGKPDTYFNFDKFVDLEKSYGFKSAFNIAALANRRHSKYDPLYSVSNPRILKAIELIKKEGWEIGLHGSYDSYKDTDMLVAEKANLESASKTKIRGISQHYLRLECPQTWESQVEADFQYDSTLGYNEALGFRCGAAFPFYPYSFEKKTSLPILALPLIIMDGVLFHELKLDSEEAVERCIKIIDAIKAHEGFGCILWHINAWDEEEFNGWIRVYKKVLDHLSMNGAWVTSPMNIATWWKERYRRICAA